MEDLDQKIAALQELIQANEDYIKVLQAVNSDHNKVLNGTPDNPGLFQQREVLRRKKEYESGAPARLSMRQTVEWQEWFKTKFGREWKEN